MAYAYTNALDIAKFNSSDGIAGLIDEVSKSAPEMSIFPGDTVPKRTFKGLVRTGLPTVGFRKYNEGVEPTKSTYTLKEFQCFLLDAQMEMDVEVAKSDDRGESEVLSAVAADHLEGGLIGIGSQIWYGTVVDSTLVLDATGTTDSTCTSVYGVIANPRYCSMLFGDGVGLQEVGWTPQWITRNSKELRVYKNAITGVIGMAWRNKYALVRIKKLTAESGKTLTDALLIQAKSKLPARFQDLLTHWFMSPRSRRQLQVSRTVTLQGNGTGNPKGNQGLVSVTPTADVDGVPIICTDSILETETLTL
jgi:hypothetical protein